MKVTKHEKLVYVDIDDTLIKRDEMGIPLDYYGDEWRVLPMQENISFVKSLKARGYYVIAHSGNGWLHAKKVIETLQLVDFIDEVKSKPLKYIDDLEVQHWFGSRIFFEENP